MTVQSVASVFALMSALNTTSTSTDMSCDNVLRAYHDVGCSVQYEISPPGWGGQLCSGIGKFMTENSTSPSYVLVGFLFSDDGTTFNYRAAARHQNRSFYLRHQNNWSAFTTVLFDDYTTLRLYDNPYLTFGFPQTSANTSNAYARGFQNTGMYFTQDFSRMEYVTGLDYVTNGLGRSVYSYLYPPSFFGKYAGYAWTKDPFFFAKNGNVDEDTVSTPYFTCYTHSIELPPPSSQREKNTSNIALCDDQFTFSESGVTFCSSTINGGKPCVNSDTLQCLQIPSSEARTNTNAGISGGGSTNHTRRLFDASTQVGIHDTAQSNAEFSARAAHLVLPNVTQRTLTSTAPCSVVHAQYVDAGCNSTQATPKPPGWAGKLCTGIGKFNFTSTPVYILVGILFSADGKSFKYRNAPEHRSKDFYLSIKTNWSLFTTILFDDYPTLRMYDNLYVTYGMPQTQCNVTDNFGRGFHNTGMYFNPDFTQMQYIVGLDYLSFDVQRELLAYIYPPNYFSEYSGLAWVKDPYYFATNGDIDEDTVTTPYFTCIDQPGESAASSTVQACDGYQTVQTNGVWTCNSTTVNGGKTCVACNNFECGNMPPFKPMNVWWND